MAELLIVEEGRVGVNVGIGAFMHLIRLRVNLFTSRNETEVSYGDKDFTCSAGAGQHVTRVVVLVAATMLKESLKKVASDFLWLKDINELY